MHWRTSEGLTPATAMEVIAVILEVVVVAIMVGGSSGSGGSFGELVW